MSRNEFDDTIIEAKRKMVIDILSQLNDDQRHKFWVVHKCAGFPKIEDIPEKYLRNAYSMCEREINKKKEVNNV